MIPQIKEINLPSYATLNKATASYIDMGEKTITSQVSIDGQITPDFSFDWEIHHKGEKFIMPLRQPQSSKENTSLSSKIDLTFQHWAIYQLKRWYFFTLQSYEAGVAVADKYIASVSLNLKNFCDLYGQLLAHYYGDAITIDLNPEWDYVKDATYIDINYSYMWDVLIKIYELFDVRWEIVPNEDPDHYVIKVGYPTDKLDHIFEYGFEGGLLKVERQVQDDNIRNMLLGRGGDKNIPFRYFKDKDPSNPTFQKDPDWCPELANVYFDRLRSAEFRSYIQGWNRRHYNGSVTYDDTYVPWAWSLGYTDTKFNPVEFVKDDESIAKYGELMGGLHNNDDIYPTIQGIVVPPYGRIDEVVDVEQVTSDAPEDAESDVKTIKLGHSKNGIGWSTDFELDTYQKKTFAEDSSDWYNRTDAGGEKRENYYWFTVPEGHTANFYASVDFYDEDAWYYGTNTNTWIWDNHKEYNPHITLDGEPTLFVINKDTGEELPASGIPPGTYFFGFRITINNGNNIRIKKRVGFDNLYVAIRDTSVGFSETFDVWIKNIWQTSKNDNESDEAYVKKVWEPILGNHLDDEAAICFSSGLLSTSEDYEFKIVGPDITRGIHYDTSKSFNGVQSHWRLTLARSSADYDALGKLVPNLERQGKAGDYFYFIGIELTHYYVKWAEEKLYLYKLAQLDKVKDITSSWVVGLDKVRIGTPHYDDTIALIEQLHCGTSVRIADKRFLGVDKELSLYLQQITYKYNESQNTANLTPDIEIVLGTDYATTASTVARIQSQIDSLSQQISVISDVTRQVRNIGDNVYLRKDASDSTPYSLTVGGGLKSEKETLFGTFFQGLTGARIDKFGNAEVESIVVRSYMKVFELIYNRLNALEGDTSFADSGTIEYVMPNDDGTYTLIMRARWDGDFTAFQKHDIIYGYVNNIGTDTNGNLADGSDNASYQYYKAWALVNSVDRAANMLNVTLYADKDVPAQKNFPLASGMTVTRWGNALNPTEDAYQADPDVRSFIIQRGGRWINTRQQSFFISTEQGNLMELMGVDAPILKKENYGTVLGQIPDGLLDSDTMSLINQGQPYLYARGIIVQDLIRIGYEGVKVKTPNMRGLWDSETAKSETAYYRSTDETVDIVSWNGALWQCIVAKASKDEPSDSNPDWIRLTASTFQIWQVVPSVNTIHIRANSYSTNLMECTVMLQDGEGEHEIKTPEELDKYDMELTFSLDGVDYKEFWVRNGEEIEGTGLTIGGNNVPWIEIQDNIWLVLRNKKTKDVKDAFVVPVTRDGADGNDGKQGASGTDGSHTEMRYKVLSVDASVPTLSNKTKREPDGWSIQQPEVGALQDLWMIQCVIDAGNALVGQWSDPIRLTGRDGKEGKQGARGLMPYPAGSFDTLRTYVTSETATPVVMDGVDGVDVGQYYCLRSGMRYKSSEVEEARNTPRKDCALDGGKYWEHFDSFNMIFANIVMADFAKLGYGVFKDEFLFSQTGVDANGNRVSTYEKFGTPDFTPNFQVDLDTGHVVMRSGEYYGSFRQRLIRIHKDNWENYVRKGTAWIEWQKAGCSLVLEDGGYTSIIAFPSLHQRYSTDEPLTDEEKSMARSYIGATVLVYNKRTFSDAEITGNIIEQFISTKIENLRPVRITTEIRTDLISIPMGYVRSFTCQLGKYNDESEEEELLWVASPACKII